MDLSNMFGKMHEMEAKLKEAQENLGSITAEAEAGGGMVKILVNGKKQVLKIEIDDDLISPSDKEMMCDLIIAATNKAIEEVEEKGRVYLQQNAQTFMPNIPGLDKFMK